MITEEVKVGCMQAAGRIQKGGELAEMQPSKKQEGWR